ncbi:MAG: zinc ribbon domain-containing protein [Candidatus Peribacteraceae bacterium]|nr:zinc ribbon domain-containing protein [Candidatus Peribacteraceae bacterium]MDD5074309.1 zinc ribbon domain-containing protein [Candidatus Peribacteraceae bacterium]
MPTFDFICKDCSREFEFSRSFGSNRKPHCPACGSTKTEKLIAPPTIHFKGSGFFVTDSRKTEEKKTSPTKKEEKEIATEKKEEKKASPEPEKSTKETKSG